MCGKRDPICQPATTIQTHSPIKKAYRGFFCTLPRSSYLIKGTVLTLLKLPTITHRRPLMGSPDDNVIHLGRKSVKRATSPSLHSASSATFSAERAEQEGRLRLYGVPPARHGRAAISTRPAPSGSLPERRGDLTPA